MAAVRRTLQAVPTRAWAAVVGLSALASLAVAVVVGAGLSAWRGAVVDLHPGRPQPLAGSPHSSVVTVVPPPIRTPAGRAGHPAAIPSAPAPPAAPRGSGPGSGPATPAPVTVGVPVPAPPGPPVIPSPAPTPAPAGGPPAHADVVALDPLLSSLHGHGRGQAVAALEGLLAQPATTYSYEGTVRGSGPQVLIALVRTYGDRGVAAQLAARLRRDQRDRGRQSSPSPAPPSSTPGRSGDADADGEAAAPTHGEAAAPAQGDDGKEDRPDAHGSPAHGHGRG